MYLLYGLVKLKFRKFSILFLVQFQFRKITNIMCREYVIESLEFSLDIVLKNPIYILHFETGLQ